MTRPLAAALCALAVIAPGAGAASLTPDRGCYVAGQPVMLTGAAFTPNSAVTLAGAAGAGVTADPAGAFAATVAAPKAATGKVARTTVTATDSSGVATLSSVAQRAWSNAPVTGAPTQRVTWRFAGFFTPGRAIYAHVRFGGRTLVNHRFGLPYGACGTLTARAARVPLRRTSSLRAGVWRIKLDQAPTYRASTPGRLLTFRISRAWYTAPDHARSPATTRTVLLAGAGTSGAGGSGRPGCARARSCPRRSARRPAPAGGRRP